MSKIVKTVNTDRVELWRAIPLSTPFTLNVHATNCCDFRCGYCIQTLPSQQFVERYGKKEHLSFETFRRAIDGLSAFPEKLKCILFAGCGEPLLNPDLPKMIAYASKANVTERIEIITNANTLTKEKSDALLDAGLTRLRISVQGLSAEKYKEISDVNIDFQKYLEQIRYFYEKKQGTACSVYVKIADVALVDGEDEKFYQMFDDISDEMAIEHIVKAFEGVEYEKFGRDLAATKSETSIQTVEVCPFPFFSITLAASGNIVNCHETSFSVVGNVRDMSIYGAWRSEKTMAFWKERLKKNNHQAKCQNCHLSLILIKDLDYLDHKADEILRRLEE